MRSNPAVMLALGDPAADSTSCLLRATRTLLDATASEVAPAAFFDTYARRMSVIGLSRDEYLSTYSLALRIWPTRILGWAGRSHLGERGLQTSLAV